MPELLRLIRSAVLANRYLIGQHAFERLDERGIPDWQIVESIESGELLKERLDDSPNPSVEIEQLLSDGTPVKAVWAWIAYDQVAKLVTVHYFDKQ